MSLSTVILVGVCSIVGIYLLWSFISPILHAAGMSTPHMGDEEDRPNPLDQ